MLGSLVVSDLLPTLTICVWILQKSRWFTNVLLLLKVENKQNSGRVLHVAEKSLGSPKFGFNFYEMYKTGSLLNGFQSHSI